MNAFAGELRQVFSNLIVNAADALEKSGDKLCVHVFESFNWTNPAQRGLRITISDNGSGIPAEKQEHIFEPFYTTKGSKGTGIGLWVCLGIVQKIRRKNSVQKHRQAGTFWHYVLRVSSRPPCTRGSYVDGFLMRPTGSIKMEGSVRSSRLPFSYKFDE